MTSHKAKPARFQSIKSTSGEPFEFADRATALLACYLLAGVRWPDKRFASITSLHCEVSQDGWRLDDLLVAFATAGQPRRLALSLKSNCQFTQRNAPKDLVAAAWRQWLGLNDGCFAGDRDYWGILTAPHAPRIRDAIHGLIEDARNQPAGALAGRIGEKREPSKIKRALFQSFACPSGLAQQAGNPSQSDDITALLSRFVFWECDFISSPSASEALAISLCQQCLADDARARAPELWQAILQVCGEVRVKGGIIDLPKLLARLRAQFRLKAHPSFAATWARIRSRSVSAAESVRMGLADSPPVPRTALVDRLRAALGASHVCLLAGLSGAGKSVLARMCCEEAERTGSTYLWLRGRDLDLPGPVSLEERLGLDCKLAELLQAAPNPSPLLVLDGLEACFSEDGFHRAASLMNAAGVDHWRVVIICQTEDWDRVRSALQKAGAKFAQEPKEMEVGSFTQEEGRQQLKAFPALHRLLNQPQVSDFILKPKILDLLARHLSAQHAQVRLFATEADLVDWFWGEVVCKDGPVSNRDQFLRRLGVHQGDQLETATSIDALGLAGHDRDVVSELVRDRILAEDPDAGLLRFDHDLLADWARERELRRHSGALPEFLSGRLTRPLWHRALRLYGLRLLEYDPTASSWLGAYEAFKPGPAVNDLGRILLLQSAVFASAVFPDLDELWPELIKTEGVMLQDFLRQFHLCATRANPDILEHCEKTRPDLVLHAAALHRVPWLADWPGLFRFLRLHTDEALSFAAEEIAILCVTWLDAANPKWASAHDAAHLAIAAARFADKSGGSWRSPRHEGSEADPAYRALLSASEVLPNEVGQLVLEFSGRRLPAGTDEASLADDEPHDIFNLPFGKRRPWPDGPCYEANDDFRKAFLHANNVISLMRANPEVASEALLALLLDRPREHEYERRSGGITTAAQGFVDDIVLEMQSPIWFRGPFIHFLRAQPQAALETTVRLVNFATDRCLSSIDCHWGPVSIEIEFTGGKQLWIGNERTYFWSLEHSGTSSSVSCALTALERFFYEQMEAGQSIEDFIQYILSNTRSLAFAGLLLRVGRKEPSLLGGYLLPLFRVAEFHKIEADGRPFDACAGLLEPRQERQARKEWYEQPHRKIHLHAFARHLFLSNPAWRPVFEELRLQWLARAESAPPDKPAPRILQALAASFELTNYRERKGDSGETVFEYVPPAHLEQRDPERVRRIEEQEMIASALAACHGLFSGEVPFSALTPEDLWHRIELLSNLDRPDETQDFQEALGACCALAAVLVEFHHEWLRARPDEEATCTAILLHANAARLPTLDRGGSNLPGMSPTVLSASALPVIWKDSSRMRRVRAALARLVLSGSDSTLRALMFSAARFRDVLAEHFQQLEWLVQGWAVARHLEQRQQYCLKKEFDLVEWCRQHAALFIRGRLPCPGNSFAEVAQPDPRRLIAGHHGHTDRRDTGIDIQCLLAGYAWASDLTDARSVQERRRFITIHRQILDCAMAAFHVDPPDDQADFYGPYEDEKVLINTIASILLQLHDDEDASQLWRPIMELAPKSRFWGMTFISDLSLPCLERPDRVPQLKRVWREMLDFAFQSPAWLAQPTWDHRELRELWCDLLRVESNYWSEDDPPTVDLLRFLSPYLERWARVSLQDGSNSIVLIQLLLSKAAAFLRCDGLLWLSRGVPVNEAWEWEDKGIQDGLVSLLVLIAEKHGSELRSRADVYAAFLAFATRLAALQNGVAVELFHRINQQA